MRKFKKNMNIIQNINWRSRKILTIWMWFRSKAFSLV